MRFLELVDRQQQAQSYMAQLLGDVVQLAAMDADAEEIGDEGWEIHTQWRHAVGACATWARSAEYWRRLNGSTRVSPETQVTCHIDLVHSENMPIR